jgi:hypothetical protein
MAYHVVVPVICSSHIISASCKKKVGDRHGKTEINPKLKATDPWFAKQLSLVRFINAHFVAKKRQDMQMACYKLNLSKMIFFGRLQLLSHSFVAFALQQLTWRLSKAQAVPPQLVY